MEKREIKFRAWDKQKKEWLIPSTFAVLGSGFGMQYSGMWRSLDLDKFAVSQFTGLLDKNGKEIYEGDRVKCFDNSDRYQGAIVFDKGAFSVQIENCLTNVTSYDIGQTPAMFDFTEFEIVGNIYEKEIK